MSQTETFRTLQRDEHERWQRDGYLIMRHFFAPDEMQILSEEAWKLTYQRDLIDKMNLRCRFQQTHDDADCLWETFDPVIDLSPLINQVAFDHRLMNLLHDLYGEPACLFKDKLIFKQPGTKGYELHQDWISWPGFPRSFLTVLIPLDAASIENGCTEVFPGYHQEGSLAPEDGEYHSLQAGIVEEDKAVPLVMEPGDIAVFDGFTPHRSAPNLSQDWRRQLYLSYNALSDGGDQRAAHYEEFRVYLERRYAEFGLNETYFR
ncbi:phytanoyl-CoA dioxygenase family protein [Gimesia sp.]|uniref:phytanoyl-CoA dioxygenase family protein n=1 Tax=Gimesia sp. TaxID=2024833 RepID=UPI003A8EFE9F